MGESTKIEWAAHSASPWMGCEHATQADGTPHPGCLSCYAETMAKRNPGVLGVWGPNGTRVASKSFHDNCRRWNAAAAKAGVRQSVFPSICDPFEDWQGAIINSNGAPLHRGDAWGSKGNYLGIPSLFIGKSLVKMNDLRADLFRTIDSCPWLDFLLLTKRPENVRRMWCSHANTDGRPPSKLYRHNAHLLYSASDQASLESGIAPLIACWDLGQAIGLSLEPLVGPIDLAGCIDQLNWVIVGGESGANARPCDVAWIRSIVRQCEAAEVPCFVKQLGQNVHATEGIDPLDQFPGSPSFSQGPGIDTAIVKLRDKKGGDVSEFPADLRVRQYPAEFTA